MRTSNSSVVKYAVSYDVFALLYCSLVSTKFSILSIWYLNLMLLVLTFMYYLCLCITYVLGIWYLCL